MSKIVTDAWTFVNDSQRTTNALQWEPEVVAIALLFLAFKVTKLQERLDWEDRNPDEQWWEVFVENLTVNMIEKICHAVLDSLQQTVQSARQYIINAISNV